MLTKYREDQERDYHGRFAEEGAGDSGDGSGGEASSHLGYHAVHTEATNNFNSHGASGLDTWADQEAKRIAGATVANPPEFATRKMYPTNQVDTVSAALALGHKYPAAFASITAFRVAGIRGNGVLAQTEPLGNIISFNTKYFGPRSGLDVLRYAGNQLAPDTANVRGIVAHEFGHAFMNWSMFKNHGADQGLRDQVNDLRQEIFKAGKSTSAYASKSGPEAFAEVFSAHEMQHPDSWNAATHLMDRYITLVHQMMKTIPKKALTTKYREDQDRDYHGRFEDEGAGNDRSSSGDDSGGMVYSTGLGRNVPDKNGGAAIAKKAYTGTFAGYRTDAHRILLNNDAGDNYLIDGRIYDKDNQHVGSFSREFNTGDKSVLHDSLTLDEEVQGNGFSTAFNAHAFAEYKKAGFKEVRLRANIDVGGYAWAKARFEFDGEEDAHTVANKFDSEHESLLDEHVRSKKARASIVAEIHGLINRAYDGKHVTPYEFSQIGRQHTWKDENGRTTWLGKTVMLDSEWNGVLRL